MNGDLALAAFKLSPKLAGLVGLGAVIGAMVGAVVRPGPDYTAQLDRIEFRLIELDVNQELITRRLGLTRVEVEVPNES